MIDLNIGREGMKIHVIIDKSSLPIITAISLDNTHDSKAFRELYDNIEYKSKDFIETQYRVQIS
ncbi:MAG: hypothetical protein QXY40_01335 [Candidatus Methanomethylicia archaeon]